MEPSRSNYTLAGTVLSLILGTVAMAAEPNGATSLVPGGKAAIKADGARIEFAEPVYDFGKVDSGAIVKYSYIFTNSGNAVLEVNGVKPGCGCTTAGEWDNRVEPGKTGSIPIQFNSGGYGGEVHKTVTVSCNDPAHPEVILQLKGNVWRPIEIQPAFAMFTPGPDIQTNETRVVKIVNNLEEPLTLSDMQSTNSAFKAELKTVREGKEFELVVTAITPFRSEHVWSPIILKTSSSRMPTITVNCYLNVQPAIAVLPSQITLPQGPLTNDLKMSLTIRNNTTNSISFSEPAITVAGVELKLAALQPGRVFNLTATFPKGFQSQPGEPMEASLKSDSPGYPVVKIPIIQMPSPTAVTPPRGTSSTSATQTPTRQAVAASNSSPLAAH